MNGAEHSPVGAALESPSGAEVLRRSWGSESASGALAASALALVPLRGSATRGSWEADIVRTVYVPVSSPSDSDDDEEVRAGSSFEAIGFVWR